MLYLVYDYMDGGDLGRALAVPGSTGLFLPERVKVWRMLSVHACCLRNSPIVFRSVARVTFFFPLCVGLIA